MPVIQRFKDWSRVEGTNVSVTFQHTSPSHPYFNLEYDPTDTSIEVTVNADGITQYLPQKHWDELVQVIELMDVEAKAFYSAVNDAVAEATVDDDHDLQHHEPDPEAPF